MHHAENYQHHNRLASVTQYRLLVNQGLLYVNVDLSGKQASVKAAVDSAAEHENDVHIAGYSDAILRFVAERGESNSQVCVCVCCVVCACVCVFICLRLCGGVKVCNETYAYSYVLLLATCHPHANAHPR